MSNIVLCFDIFLINKLSLEKKDTAIQLLCAKKEQKLLLDFWKAKQWDVKEADHNFGEP